MTIGDLRVLVDNLDEYIHIPGGIERLKKTVLHLAVSGQLVPQDASEGSGEELYKQIQAVKTTNKKSIPGITDTPFDIPKSWEWVHLGNLLVIERGGSPRPIKEYLTDDSNGIKWIKIGDSDIGGRYITKTAEKIKPSGLKKTRQVFAGDLILSNSMSFGRPYILKIDGCIHDGWLLLRDESGKLSKEFLYYLLSSELCKKQFADKTSGAVVQNLNSDKVRTVLVPLMPVAEQQRIVEKVDQIFMLIDELEGQHKVEEAERSKFVRSSLYTLSHGSSHLALDNLDDVIKTKADTAELRKAILHLAVSGGISSHPEEFNHETLDNLIELKTGRLDANAAVIGGQYPFFTCSREISQIDMYAYDTECVLLAGNGDFNVKYYSGKFEAYQRTYILESKDKKVLEVPYLFLVMQVRSGELLGEAMGSAMPYIRKANVLSTKINLPSVAEQGRIVAKTNELLNLVAELEKHLEN
jgi:type I restriction enzyme S subunit